MRGKMLQKIIALFLVMILTMTNFIMLGSNIAIAASETTQGQSFDTNNKNIEFGAYFKNEKGEQMSSFDIKSSGLETSLFLYLNVKNEGYISNAQIKLENANFDIKEAVNSYINSINGNTITLNQINAGRPVEIELKIRFKRNDAFDLSLLNAQTNISLEAIYRDSSERDIQVRATRVVDLNLVSDNSLIDTSLEIITNKVLSISGENKRVIQLSLNLGLKDNDYPVKEITGQVEILAIDGKMPQVSGAINLNSMTNGEYKYSNGIFEFSFKNTATDDNLIWWKEAGKENLIITCIYDENVKIENNIAKTNATLTLYNDEVLRTENLETIIDNTEKESVVTSTTTNSDSVIYKGKLNSSIDREFSTTHVVSVNMTGVTDKLEIVEQNKLHTAQIDNQEDIAEGTDFNYVYKSTVLNKEEVDKLLGDDGKIEIRDAQNNLVTTIDKNTQADESGNIVIDYGEGRIGIVITTTEPVECGKLTIQHNKIIKGNSESSLSDKILLSSILYVRTNLNQDNPTSMAITRLENSQTEVELQIDKKEFSTILENDVEIKAILKSKDEKNDLFNAPTLRINFPESIETININSVELAYEDELKIKNYTLNGRTLIIELEGRQTQYKDLAIEGANVIINASLKLNRKTASQDTAITMDYTNGTKTGNSSAAIKIVAPTEVTTISSISELAIEEIEQNTVKENRVNVNTDTQTITPQIQIINNKSTAIENVKVLGTFPTNNNQNSMNIVLTAAMSIANAKVYYTENIDATDDITQANNGWQESIINPDKVQKYLILIDRLEPQAEVTASYIAEIPARLEYNQESTFGYTVTYTDSETNTSGTVKATDIKLTTGTGPIAEISMTASVGNAQVNNGDTVVAGEVVKYHLTIKNTGTEDITDATITAPIPEGATYVKEKAYYEYTGTSYYEELSDRNYQTKIDSLPVGQTIEITYEVRVNNDINDGQTIDNKYQISYKDVVKESNSISLVGQSGDIRITLKRVTDRNSKLYASSSVKYYAIVENISENDKENVYVDTHLPEELQANHASIITGLKSADITADDITNPDSDGTSVDTSGDINEISKDAESEDIEYNETINIGSLKSGETKVLYFETIVGQVNETKNVSLYAIARDDAKQYRSNLWTETINGYNVSMTMSHNTETQYVKAGDVIEYTINIRNNNNIQANGIEIVDQIPEQCTIRSITVAGENIDIPESHEIHIPVSMEPNGEVEIKISVVVDESETRTEPEKIINKATAVVLNEEIATTNEVSHIIEASTEAGDNNNGNNNGNNNNGNDNNDVEDNNTASGNRIISGVAWNDTNANGQRDSGEPTFNNVKVRLLNVETNRLVTTQDGRVLEATTDDTGTYFLNNIGNGRYIVIFDYDTVAYTTTKYRAEGISDAENSDAMKNRITLDGEEQEVTSTDVITVANNNISDIDIGLIELRNFDLKLEKFVSKISIQTSAGTTVREYTDETMAKLELDARVVNGATAIVEYTIRVTNAGEVEGYARRIVDYIANDYSFSSEINKDWYQSENNLYNASLANEKILPGESKDIKLTLIKNLTENNIGLINNTAEISEDYNELGIEDSNSTPGNNAKDENDMGSADVIISIRTGADVILYTIFYTIIALGIIAIIIIPIRMKTKKTKHKLDKI